MAPILVRPGVVGQLAVNLRNDRCAIATTRRRISAHDDFAKIGRADDQRPQMCGIPRESPDNLPLPPCRRRASHGLQAG
jgi:hypothetical protein